MTDEIVLFDRLELINWPSLSTGNFSSTINSWYVLSRTPVGWQLKDVRETELYGGIPISTGAFNIPIDRKELFWSDEMVNRWSSHSWVFNNDLIMSSGTLFGMLCCGTILNGKHNMNRRRRTWRSKCNRTLTLPQRLQKGCHKRDQD